MEKEKVFKNKRVRDKKTKEKKVSEKKIREKKILGKTIIEKKDKKDKRDKKPVKLKKLRIGIGSKIAVCFLIPIIFMIVIGVSAYTKSEEGMSEKFQDSTVQTIEMARDYIDMSCTFIESEGMKYAANDDLIKYLAGNLERSPVERLKVLDGIEADMLSSQTTNPFIQDIHIVSREIVSIVSTATGEEKKGILNDYKDYVGITSQGVTPWIDDHAILDEYLGIENNDSILSYEILNQRSSGCIVIDIKTSAIQEFIDGLDLGEGSIVGFITPSGKEVISERLEEGQESSLQPGEKVFFDKDFYQTVNEENMQGVLSVNFNGEENLFIYSRSEITGATVCALVPMKIVTSQAQDIKSLTITLILIACFIVLAVGILTVAGIQNNMKRISAKFGEVAKGDLTVEVKVKGRDEFQSLAGSATNMIVNTKKLVNKVSNATKQLEESAVGVGEASGVINEYSTEITRAIDEINEGMGRQSRHAQQCVTLTDVLSDDIKEVSNVVEKVEKLVTETEDMINQGMGIIQVLGDKAKETTEMTTKVTESIRSLKKESEIINSFVETITSISSQTNLLSLNASIEAARAGEAGRGFAVVAEEIRKLADDSAKAAGQIQNNVANIDAQTINSVNSANQAQDMVASQTKAVEEVVAVFGEMRNQMDQLVQGLKEIVVSIEKADMERSDTVHAVKDISGIIEETAGSAEVVKDIAAKLLTNVENLNHTADVLGENMQGLKSEISVFKI